VVWGAASGAGARAGTGRGAADLVVAVPPSAGRGAAGAAGAGAVIANVPTSASAAAVLSPAVRIRLAPAAWRRRPGFRPAVLDGERAAARSALALSSSFISLVIVVVGTVVVTALGTVVVVPNGPCGRIVPG
jgi:hypothetical protein